MKKIYNSPEIELITQVGQGYDVLSGSPLSETGVDFNDFLTDDNL